MDINKAYKANDFIKEIEILKNKIKWIDEFSKKSNDYYRGELSFRSMDGAIYNIPLNEKYELDELINLILGYYNNKKESLLKAIEEL